MMKSVELKFFSIEQGNIVNDNVIPTEIDEIVLVVRSKLYDIYPWEKMFDV